MSSTSAAPGHDDDAAETRPLLSPTTGHDASNVPVRHLHAATYETVARHADDDAGEDQQRVGSPTPSTDSLLSVDPATQHAKKRLWIASALCFSFFLVELIGGIWSNSLAILSDSFHLLSDFSGFLISLFSLYLAQRKATKRHSFGFHRAEILGALVSVLIIWVVTGVLIMEAVDRMHNPRPIDGPIMLAVASMGLVVNFILVFALGHGHDHGHGHGHDHGHAHQHSHNEVDAAEQGHGHHDHGHAHGHGHNHRNINLRAAIIHIIGDIVSSVGVLISSVIITLYPEWVIVDPICTFFFSAIVMCTTFALIRDSIGILMESTPAHIDPHQIETDLLAIPNILAVHDLHVWVLTVGKPALAVHVEVPAHLPVAEYDLVLTSAQDLLCDKYSVHHTTIQVDVRFDGVAPDPHCASSVCNGGVCGGAAARSRSPREGTGSPWSAGPARISPTETPVWDPAVVGICKT
ncbi:hypothetical protein GGF31_005810 [Allomyces arbusculus]|nr:hypothetical protein GGF31_005810 [Allomyces arbusculus]